MYAKVEQKGCTLENDFIAKMSLKSIVLIIVNVNILSISFTILYSFFQHFACAHFKLASYYRGMLSWEKGFQYKIVSQT